MISIRFGAVRTSSQVKRKKSHRRYAKMHIACVFILIEEKRRIGENKRGTE